MPTLESNINWAHVGAYLQSWHGRVDDNFGVRRTDAVGTSRVFAMVSERSILGSQKTRRRGRERAWFRSETKW